MYGPDGKKIHTFTINDGLPDKKKTDSNARQVIPTKDYIVFYNGKFLRVFNKKDGAFIDEVELSFDGKIHPPKQITTDGENRVYILDQDSRIFRIDL